MDSNKLLKLVLELVHISELESCAEGFQRVGLGWGIWQISVSLGLVVLVKIPLPRKRSNPLACSLSSLQFIKYFG